MHNLLAKEIDEYVVLRTKVVESNEDALQMDPRLQEIVEIMLDKFILESKFPQVVGIALDYRLLELMGWNAKLSILGFSIGQRT